MDKTEQYRKMCGKAVKLQEAWQPEVGDYVWREFTVFGDEIDSLIWGEKDRREIIILHFKSCIEGFYAATNAEGGERIYNSNKELYKATCVCLFRLDQLLAMFQGLVVDASPRKLCKVLWDWCAATSSPSEWSMEQICLACFMEKKWGLVWTGEDWEEVK